MIYDSDVAQGDRIWCARVAIYNKQYKPEHTDHMVTMFKKAIPVFRTMLDFPEDTKFRIAPIKARNKSGMYRERTKTVTVDNRLKLDQALEVLAHELVHAEQYHQGRMTWEKGYNYWQGERWCKGQGSNYTAYRNLPWEKEAWGRQAELADIVDRKLGMVYIKRSIDDLIKE